MSIDYQNFKKDKKPKKEYGYAARGDVLLIINTLYIEHMMELFKVM